MTGTARHGRDEGRRIIVQELVSVDGYVAGPSGELDFFDTVADYTEVDQDNLTFLREVDTILLGSETYRLFVDYWPTAEGELIAEAVNTTPKIVFSTTLENAPWGKWEPARVVGGSAVENVNELRRGSGGDVIVWGSISLAQSLLGAGLVDEVQLRVVPIAIGRGRSLFADKHALTLIEAKAYESGIVSLRYAATGNGGS